LCPKGTLSQTIFELYQACGSSQAARGDGSFATVNEFYKKGCQEKSSASTGVEILSRDPAHGSFASREKFGLLSMLMSVSADGDDAVEFKRAASELVASEATMVLSEARGL